MRYFWDQYLAREDDALHPYAAPLRASSLAALAPAVIVHAEHDPLRSEGQAYAERLHQGGVPMTELHYPGTVHGFVGWFANVAVSRTAVSDIVAALQTSFGR